VFPWNSSTGRSTLWKRQRLLTLGLSIPAWLQLVPVDFERGGSWREQLVAAGFDAGRQTVVSSSGVSMYLTRDAVAATLRIISALAPGSTLAMSFMLPLEFVEAEERPLGAATEHGARASGTPMLGFFSPPEILILAREAGFREVHHISAANLTQRYFADHSDGLRPFSSEELLVAGT
jgi:methyltransferase (TIGR00027 family)